LLFIQNREISSIYVRINLNIFFEKSQYREREEENVKMAKNAYKMELNSEMLVSLIRKLFAEKQKLSLY